MIDVGKYSVLTDNMIGLFISNDVGFLESLHGVIFTGLLILAEHHSAERTSTQGCREIIILEINSLFRCHYYYYNHTYGCDACHGCDYGVRF